MGRFREGREEEGRGAELFLLYSFVPDSLSTLSTLCANRHWFTRPRTEKAYYTRQREERRGGERQDPPGCSFEAEHEELDGGEADTEEPGAVFEEEGR